MTNSIECAGCKAKTPDAETEATLAVNAWRVTRTRNADGEYVVESRCPACWKKLVESKRQAR